jgi:hypothetical protein
VAVRAHSEGSSNCRTARIHADAVVLELLLDYSELGSARSDTHIVFIASISFVVPI